MQPNQPQTPKNPKQSMGIYLLVILSVLLLLNALVLPGIRTKGFQTVDYGTFLKKLDEKAVTKVSMSADETEILFVAKDEAGKEVHYKTGAFPDADLVNRLAKEKNIKFTREAPRENSFLFSFLMTWVFPTLILMLPFIFLMRMMQKKGNSMFGLGKSGAKMYVASQTGVKFEDVAGDEEAKEALSEIVDFLHNPAKYNSIGAKMPKGVLLVGPPGTGKTLIAKAVAGEANVPFFSIAGSEFVEMFVGQGAARVRDLFKQAKEKAPCIVFIDEIDTVGKKRDSGPVGGNDEREQTLNQLLSEMDGFDGSSGIVILAATNRPETLDKALLRPGRFDRRVPVELPDLKAREAILKVHAKKVMMADDIDYTAIAKSTAGCSGAELANLINESALRAVKCNRRIVTQPDLMESVDVVVAGYQRKNAVLTAHEKKVVAYHEVGHAIVAAKLKNTDPVTKITIIPRTSGALGYTMQTPDTDTVLLSKQEALSKIAILTGGRTAEEIVFKNVTSGASNDIEQATKLARSMVTRLGMSKNFDMTALETLNNQYLGGDTSLACSAQTATLVDQEVISIIKTAHAKARQILTTHLEKMHEIAAYLLEHETITGEQFMKLLNKPIQEPEISDEQVSEPQQITTEKSEQSSKPQQAPAEKSEQQSKVQQALAEKSEQPSKP